ncbi:hypothetical protein BN126310142 [Stenotrophomonas maltophilia]|nr:hypothetical protein BN126310142 [Stenotrophomonas maltophilia]
MAEGRAPAELNQQGSDPFPKGRALTPDA